MEMQANMAKKNDELGAFWVPALGEKVNFVTPQQKEIRDCIVIKMFDNRGRVRVKSADGNCYSGSLEQIKPV
jgi:precorrin-4 methylase